MTSALRRKRMKDSKGEGTIEGKKRQKLSDLNVENMILCYSGIVKENKLK